MRRIHMLLIPLFAVCLLAACTTTKTKKSQDPFAGVNTSVLAQDVFTLSDQRDMGYAVVKLEKEGFDSEALAEATRTVSVDDLLATLRRQSEQAGVAQSSTAGWVIEARNLTLRGDLYAQATIVVRREIFKIKGDQVSLATLQRLILDGQESSVAVGWALYRDVLRHAVQQ